MNYTEKILNHANKINELHNIASEAVRTGVLSSFTVNDRDHSDMIGKGLYLGLNMTYHAIELEINNIKSMMENGDKEMKEFELKVGDKVFIREDLIVGVKYGRLTWMKGHKSGLNVLSGRGQEGGYRFKNTGVLHYSKEMIDWDKTKELQSKENEAKEFRVGVIKKLLEDKLSGFNTENIRSQSTAKEIITIENTVMEKGITEVNKIHDLFHIKFNVDGVDCIVLRTTAGHLCGYIKTESEFEGDDYQGADEIFNAIGGITFVQSGYIGFDCAHYDQMSPLREYSTDGRYLPLTEVIEMTIDLASQEKKLRGGDKKEPSATFDELIDVVVQARKDKVITNVEIYNNGICATYLEDVLESSSNEEIESAIEKIKSLYTETFTIESEDDIAKIKIGASVKLSNGMTADCVSAQSRDIDKTIRLDCNTADDIFGIFVLKGATITQKKGGK